MAEVSLKGGQIWDPTKGHDGKTEKTEALPTDQIAGYLVGVKYEQGKDKKSTVYQLQPEEGESKSIWGTTLLNEMLANVRLGNWVRIVWKGKVQPKTPGGRPYHTWEAFEDATKVHENFRGDNAQKQVEALAGDKEKVSTTATENKVEKAPPVDDLPF